MTERLSRMFASKIGADIYNKALSIIKEYCMDDMLKGGALIGFSGGPDSVMLLCVLKKFLEENSCEGICAVHVNHMIRGAEAERDEDFSREFCDRLGVEFISVRRNVPELARSSSQGIEEAARSIRYSAFDEIIKGIKSKKSNEEAEDYLKKNLTPNQNKKLKEVLSDKEAVKKLLSTPKAQELLKKFTEDKND